MKFITGIVAFSLTFILSVALVGFPETNYEAQVFELRNNFKTEQNISYLLNQDIRNGDKRDGKIYALEFAYDSNRVSGEYAEIIDEYVDASNSLDDTQLPADFQLAWQNHMRAWRNHSNFLSKSRNSCKMRKMNSEDFAKVFEQQEREILRTWRKTLSVAAKYGATVPYQYY